MNALLLLLVLNSTLVLHSGTRIAVDLATLMAPVLPFTSEEIWALMPGADDLLMGHRWPEPDASPSAQAR